MSKYLTCVPALFLGLERNIMKQICDKDTSVAVLPKSVFPLVKTHSGEQNSSKMITDEGNLQVTIISYNFEPYQVPSPFTRLFADSL